VHGGCCNPDQKKLITTAANEAVHKIASYIRNGKYGRWTVLVNAGTRFAESKKQDDTCPAWMGVQRIVSQPDDEVEEPGEIGKFKDKPDIVIVVGWEPGQPPPTPGTPGIKFIVFEHCCALCT
jgi:hypothetical protein